MALLLYIILSFIYERSDWDLNQAWNWSKLRVIYKRYVYFILERLYEFVKAIASFSIY